MRGRVINWGCVGPALAYLAVAAALTAGAINLAHHGARDLPTASPAVHGQFDEDLQPELARCETLGNRAQDDPRCIAAWMENRRRFFSGAAPHPATQPASTIKSEGPPKP